MPDFEQSGRLLSVKSPLGDNALILTGFRGREELSKPFRFELDLMSPHDVIAARDIVGKDLTWTVFSEDHSPRHFNGKVVRFSAGGAGARGHRSYRAEVAPWLWFLGLSSGCRIFQNKSVPDIVKAIFDEPGFTDYEFNLGGTHAKREYCVQYRESSLDFIARLMEEEGMFYFFHHEDGKHTLKVADQASGYEKCDYDKVEFHGGLSDGAVGGWQHNYEFVPGKWAATDYDFEKPTTSLLSTTDTLVDLTDIAKGERYDYPGGFLTRDDGESVVKARMEAEEAAHDVVSGASASRHFFPGGKFTLEGHDVDAENQEYALTSVDHTASDPSATGGGGKGEYSNTFTCIPASVLYRPLQNTPRSVVRGPQTAVVVGKSGEELYVDKYGRIKVQFHWDREGANDEKSSCWVRVAQTIAGKNWGTFFHPRIGQEVVVEFLEGDPDRPLVTGCVYNASNMPPYALPDNATMSGFKSNTSKGGDGFNELSFEDKKDSEMIYCHAQKDMKRVVENDDVTEIKHDQKVTIKNDRTQEVSEGNDKYTISKGDHTFEVSKGKHGVTIQGDSTVEIKQGGQTTTIKMGDQTTKLSMGNQTTKLDLGAISSEAMQGIELKVGQNSLKIDQTGITIKGLMVKIEGTVQAEFKGLMATVSADAMLQMKGAITMIG
ncbi:MAG: type VI secretion system tip protein VgrG [Gemmataceae bacterium]